MRENVYELMYMSRMCDSYAQEALFHLYQPLIRKIVNVYVSGFRSTEPFREDITEEAMTAMFQALDCYRSDKNADITTFVSLVVKRRVISSIRKYRRYTMISSQYVLNMDYLVSNEDTLGDLLESECNLDDPEYYLHYRDAMERMTNAYHALNVQEKDLVSSWYQGEKHADAARKRNMNLDIYESRLYRVKGKIKRAAKGE